MKVGKIQHWFHHFFPTYLVGLLLLVGTNQSVKAQDYKTFREKIDEQLKSYRETVECEQKVAIKLRNLRELMQITPDKPEIVKSCNFLNSNKDGSCPQSAVRNLAVEIKRAYLNGQKEAEIIAQDSATVGLNDTINSPETPTVEPTETTPAAPTPYKDYVLYISVGVLSLLCIWLMYKLNQIKTIINNTPISTSTQYTQSQQLPVMNDEILERLNSEVSKLKDENNWLRKEFGRMNSQLNGLMELLEDTVRRVNRLDEGQPDVAAIPSNQEPSTFSPAEPANVPPPATPVIIPAAQDMRYALYMDNSEGFSVTGLMPFANAETIYEIVLQSDRNATYRIFNHFEAQQYALTDPSYYLRTACEYENSPVMGKRIDTVTEGVLENIGSVWKITKKAKIRFV